MSDEIIEDGDEMASQEADDLQTLDERFTELEQELAEARDAQLRAIADFQNYRRRSLDEAIKTRELATANLVEKLLPLLDNFERSLAAAESGASPEAVLEGVRLMQRQLGSALQGVNVKPIDAVGQQFDPHYHEAILSEPSDQPEGTVLEVIEAGYTMGSRVLRPAKTRVSKGPA
ncbi:MAG: nucleotide exchange factor GrpE [Fimbriimonadales bacterium]